MTIFQHLKNDQRLQDAPEFVHLLLCRLSIAEVVAASKFKKPIVDEVELESNVIKKIREKCNALNYSAPRTDAIASIFKEIVTIAKLIQTAWLIQSKDTSDAVVKREAISLAKAITLTEVTNDNILTSIREYATKLTSQILDSLNKPEGIGQLEIVTSLLKECFPHIDVSKLDNAIITMSRGIDELKLMSIADEDLDDTIIVDSGVEGQIVERPSLSDGLKENGIFRPAARASNDGLGTQQHQNNWLGCTIS